MNPSRFLAALFLAASLPSLLRAAPPSLTIYNQDFAVVRDAVPLDLKQGINEVTFDGATLRLEPDSVILRDASGAPLRILEQNYRNDPVSQRFLLSLFEGKEIDFAVHEQQKPDRVVKGKVIRSGYVPQGASGGQGMEEPIIQTEGKIRFKLPGEPLFPSLGDDTILKPRLAWKIEAPKALKTSAELGYVTGGLSWEASYNLVAPEKGEKLDLIGWVTMDNQSGREFRDAKVALMAGDVNKVAPAPAFAMKVGRAMSMVADAAPAVTEKTFDEYHLYTLERPVTLHDHGKVQVEFLHAAGVDSEVIYTYDGAAGLLPDASSGRPLLEGEINPEGNRKITVTREFRNTKENGLGIPLPKGKMRLYRANGAQLEFTGENTIDHTPKDETVRIKTGEAFDLTGARKRTDFKTDMANHWMEESFEITLRNHKKETVTVRVVEHLFRWMNWQIKQQSDPFAKKDAQTIDFRIQLKPDEEKKLTYKVRYSW